MTGALAVEKNEVQEIIRALNDSRVRYLIVGGLAVVAHGYVRFTADLDLVLAVDEPNLRQAVDALQMLDYQPRAPVPFEQFIDPAMRNKWASEKGMRVFSLFSLTNPKTEVDLFLEPPLDFTPAYDRALRSTTAPLSGPVSPPPAGGALPQIATSG